MAFNVAVRARLSICLDLVLCNRNDAETVIRIKLLNYDLKSLLIKLFYNTFIYLGTLKGSNGECHWHYDDLIYTGQFIVGLTNIVRLFVGHL